MILIIGAFIHLYITYILLSRGDLQAAVTVSSIVNVVLLVFVGMQQINIRKHKTALLWFVNHVKRDDNKYPVPPEVADMVEKLGGDEEN